MTALFLWDDAAARLFAPFSLTRPVGELRAGAQLIRERWERLFGVAAEGFVSSQHLEHFEEFGAPPSAALVPAGAIIVNARCVPALDAGTTLPSLRSALVTEWVCSGRLAAVRVPHDLSADALGELESLEMLVARGPRTDGNTVQRVLCGDDRHARLVLQTRVEAVEQRTTAGKHDALLHDVGGEFGRGLVESRLDGIDDGRNRFLDRLADLVGARDDRLGQSSHQVATADLGMQFFLERPSRAERDLDLFGGALTEGEAVLLLDELDDGVVELVATHADGLAGDHATERDHGHLGGTATDVDDHVAGRFVHG